MIALQIDLSAIPAVGPENGGDGELLKANFLKATAYPDGVSGTFRAL